MQELEITWQRVASVWWLIAWRAFLGGWILAFALAFLIGSQRTPRRGVEPDVFIACLEQRPRVSLGRSTGERGGKGCHGCSTPLRGYSLAQRQTPSVMTIPEADRKFKSAFALGHSERVPQRRILIHTWQILNHEG